MGAIQVKPELLLPAGSPEKLRYAVAYGADAVYLGLPMASLRTPSRGGQFTPQNLGEHIRYAQERGVKVYVTLNIFASNHDIKRLIPHLEQLEEIRPDALIISDPGIVRLAKKHAPTVPIHISTQANTLNVEACAFWQENGAERVILAREVPLREMREIHEQLPDLELEAFVHGSLCVAYSGRCVISDYLTDNTKNSNKGMCGNSCRWEFQPTAAAAPKDPSGNSCRWELQTTDGELSSLSVQEATRPEASYTFEEDAHGTYMLNSRDLCLIEHLRQLQDAGIVSFKVEGRTKSVFYVSTVGRVYREAIDYVQSHESVPEELLTRWAYELGQAGNRGFTEGFLSGRPNHAAYNYDTSKTRQGSVFLATVADGVPVKSGQIAFRARNPFQVGDILDWMTPSGMMSVELSAMTDPAGLPVAEVQTNQIAVLPVPAAVSIDELGWSVLSRKVRAESVQPGSAACAV